ncbi:hypothetical protein LTR36_008746 [Oleoguttula mirabilis]|uniref:Uncharacterized protein n=1 Tax=Oleoguttula mirabilis TaxID=1507867 RepID=A0AAV9JTI4_9PEZI|nr:hypothetical protein LTR36_008746 [Oleoguttula mirabilis]
MSASRPSRCPRLQQSLRWQIPGTLTLLSQWPPTFIQLPPIGYHFARILEGQALVASLPTWDKLIRPRGKPADVTRPYHSEPPCLRPAVLGRPARGMETSPLRYMFNVCPVKTRAPTVVARRDSGTTETPFTSAASQQADSEAPRPSAAPPSKAFPGLSGSDIKSLYWHWGPADRTWSDLYPTDPDTPLEYIPNLPWRSGPWNPFWLGPGALSFIEYAFEWDGDCHGRKLYLTTLSNPRAETPRHIGQLAGIWSTDIALFGFFMTRPEVLLVGGPGWRERWWVDLADLEFGFYKLQDSYDMVSKSTDRPQCMVCLPFHTTTSTLDLGRMVPQAVRTSTRPTPFPHGGTVFDLGYFFEQCREPVYE